MMTLRKIYTLKKGWVLFLCISAACRSLSPIDTDSSTDSAESDSEGPPKTSPESDCESTPSVDLDTDTDTDTDTDADADTDADTDTDTDTDTDADTDADADTEIDTDTAVGPFICSDSWQTLYEGDEVYRFIQVLSDGSVALASCGSIYLIKPQGEIRFFPSVGVPASDCLTALVGDTQTLIVATRTGEAFQWDGAVWKRLREATRADRVVEFSGSAARRGNRC